MITLLKVLRGLVLTIFLPHACVVCEALSDELVCESCLVALMPTCQFRNFPPYISESVTVFGYEGALQAIISAYKHEGFEGLGPILGYKLVEVYPFAPFSGVDIWLSVPLHPNRLRLRGFDHIKNIFIPVFEAWGDHLAEGLVYRIKDTPMLFSLDKSERQFWLQDAFAVDETFSWIGKKVGIVDDILTSGSTVQALAKALCQRGVSEVVVLALSGGKL